MKEFLKKCVLCPAGEPLLPKKYRENRALRLFVRAAGIVSALLCPLYLFLMLEYIHYGGKAHLIVFLSRTRTAIFCAFVFYLLYFLLLLLMKRTFCRVAYSHRAYAYTRYCRPLQIYGDGRLSLPVGYCGTGGERARASLVCAF